MIDLTTGFYRYAIVLLSAAYLITLMFSIGLIEEPKESRREKWSLLARALSLNLIAVPALAILVTRLFRPSEDVVDAILLLSAVPGGAIAPHLTRMARGNAGMAAEICLWLAKITVFTAPLMIRWILGIRGVKISEITFLAILVVFQLIPLFAGRGVRKWRPAIANRLEPTLRTVDLSLMFLLLTMLLARGVLGTLWLVNARGWLTILVLATASLALGWFAGGPALRNRRAVALSLNSRQLALGLFAAAVAYGDRELELTTVAVFSILAGFNFLYARVFCRRTGARGAAFGRGHAPAM